MTEEVTVDEVELTEETIEQYNAFIKGARLRALDTISFAADRLRPGSSPRTEYELGSSFTIEGDTLFIRFDVTATLMGEDDEAVANVRVAQVVAFSFAGDPPPRWIIERFTAMSVSMMVTPNLREAVQSLALRLGYPGVTLPMITRLADEAALPAAELD